jgi:hypothetical protein
MGTASDSEGTTKAIGISFIATGAACFWDIAAAVEV